VSRSSALLLLLAVLLLATAVVSLGLGAVRIPVPRVIAALGNGGGDVSGGAAGSEGEALDRTIVRELRLPRLLLAILVGAGLGGSGAAYQGLFRNPLADPFVIGASSGAALGAVFAILAGGNQARAGFQLLPVSAFLGALAAVALVYALGGLGARSSPTTLLLAGAAVSTVLGAAVSLLMILKDQSLPVIFGWLLGGLSDGSWRELRSGAGPILFGLLCIRLLARPLDALSLGDETARSLGLSVGSRLAIIGAATLTTAAGVSVAGVIGFVGLMAPHGARWLLGPQHSRLIPGSCLLGALLLLAADDLARTVAIPREIPVSIVTSLLGGPFFLYLLRSRHLGEGP
jgi:iron complex transport system permease protein